MAIWEEMVSREAPHRHLLEQRERENKLHGTDEDSLLCGCGLQNHQIIEARVMSVMCAIMAAFPVQSVHAPVIGS